MFATNYKKQAIENSNFRKVLFTGKYSQIVAMSIPKGEEIGEETHPDTDQLFFFVDGEADAILNGESKRVIENDVVFVPSGTIHNFKSIGNRDLKLITIYSPPHHPDGTVHRTKSDAEKY